MIAILRAARVWIGGNAWVLWAGGAVVALVVGLWWRLDTVATERDDARSHLAVAVEANQATVAATREITAAAITAQRALADAHARALAAERRHATISAEVQHDPTPPTGCAPSLADPAPAAMLRALGGMRQ